MLLSRTTVKSFHNTDNVIQRPYAIWQLGSVYRQKDSLFDFPKTAETILDFILAANNGSFLIESDDSSQ